MSVLSLMMNEAYIYDNREMRWCVIELCAVILSLAEGNLGQLFFISHPFFTLDSDSLISHISTNIATTRSYCYNSFLWKSIHPQTYPVVLLTAIIKWLLAQHKKSERTMDIDGVSHYVFQVEVSSFTHPAPHWWEALRWYARTSQQIPKINKICRWIEKEACRAQEKARG